MRRLTFLAIAVALAWLGHHILVTSQGLPTPGAGEVAPGALAARLRDGLLLLAAAAVLAGLVAAPYFPPISPGVLRRWAGRGALWPRTLLAAGLCSLAVAGAAHGWAGMPGWLRVGLLDVLWWLGLLFLVVAAAWPGEIAAYPRPAYRWTVDAAGRFVRTALGARNTQAIALSHESDRPALGWVGLVTLGLLAGAVALRFWRLASLPPGCGDGPGLAECDLALQLAAGQPLGPAPELPGDLFALLARLFWRAQGAPGQESLWSLRLAAATIGSLTLPAFWLAARRYVGGASATLATLLLAFSPWHLGVSRLAATQAVAWPLWICLGLWAWPRCRDIRWAVWAGVAWGLLLQVAGGLGPALVLWVLALALLGGGRILPWRQESNEPEGNMGFWLMALVALAVGLPGWTSGHWQGAAEGAGWFPLLTALLAWGGMPALPYFTEAPLLDGISLVLATVGLGVLARYGTHPPAAGLLIGLTLLALWTPFAPASAAPAGGLLAWLPLLVLAAAVGLEQILVTGIQTWRPVFRPQSILAAALVVLVLAAVPGSLRLVGQLEQVGRSGSDSVAVAMARYVADCLQGEAASGRGNPCRPQGGQDAADESFVLLVPPSLLAGESQAATLHLMAAHALDDPRVRPLDPAEVLPFPGVPEGDLIYLVAMEDQPLIDLLRLFYPGGEIQAEPGASNQEVAGPSLFVTYRVPRDLLDRRQGLQGFYFSGPAVGLPEEAALVHQDGPLAFPWGEEPPLPPPFSVQWEGSLRVPVDGVYRFVVDLGAVGSPALFSLQLDRTIVLDTSLGLTEQRISLARGLYHLTMRYRSGDQPADLALRWEPPGGSLTAIPRPFLYGPPFPNVGLVGSYFAGSRLEGPLLSLRKDPLPGLPVELPQPYSVRWEGKLAAPRAGEYLLASVSDGFVQVLVDGQTVVDSQFAQDDAPAYAQGSIYLEPGWHPLEIRHVPDPRAPGLRLLWQPPGSSPSPLSSRYLSPVLAQVQPGDLALPDAPALLDPRLGEPSGRGDFALSYTFDLYQPRLAIPPGDLPTLLAEPLWQVGGNCGAAPVLTPRGVALDLARGQLYVADSGNQDVALFDLAGNLVRRFSSELFQEPVDLAAADGVVWVLDAGSQQVIRLDPATGQVQALAGQVGFYRPRGIAVDAAGHLLVADTGGARVALLDAAGNLLGQYGGRDTQLGRGQPVDTLAVGETAWAVTAEDGRLWRLDDLASVVALPRSTTLDGPHLAGLPDGSFFLSDPVRHRIQYHTAGGRPWRQLVDPALLHTPVGVDAALQGDEVLLAVADSGACRLTLWRLPAAGLVP
ncbi:MAG: hypothetical protein KatS3mg050_0111 [Litorilinea sp.]|nr:MAG: hypothetical protein KatS3mg050_0111 [Litorilinea sp.]